VVRFGQPTECIVESARTRHADLIVMATHGRTGPGRWVFGSVAEAVIASSTVPVLVQRAWQPLPGKPLHNGSPKLVVPLDGSCFSEAVLESAAVLAENLDGRLVLVRVEASPGAIRTATDYLMAVQADLESAHPTVPIARKIGYGDPARGIDEAVVQIAGDLVVMATHGRTGARRAILGSVAGKLLQASQVPLALLHH
jgi:nucleotide-binding universal stress UspA family protein